MPVDCGGVRRMFSVLLLLPLVAGLLGLPSDKVSARISSGIAVQDRSNRDTAATSYSEKFDVVWNRVRERFYDPNLHGVDWNRIGEKYRSQLNTIQTKADFAELITRMLGELKASHTEYMTDDDVGFYMLPAVLRGSVEANKVTHIGVMGKHEEKGFRVAGVLEGGPAEAAGIRSGDLLLSADGEPFTTAGAFQRKEGERVEITLRRGGEGNALAVTVVPVRNSMLKAFLDATIKSARVMEVEGKRIGYVHLWTMAHDSFREALHQIVLDKLYDTDGLILDIRDGYGGRPEGFAAPFFLPDISWEQEMRGRESVVRRGGYGKPMVVLVNSGTRSAKEYFAYQFKKSGRAPLIGTRTAGAFLGANAFPVGKDGLLELPVVGLKLDGRRIEGQGIEPDIAVAPNATYTAQDSQLARAVETLKTRINRPGREVASKPRQ